MKYLVHFYCLSIVFLTQLLFAHGALAGTSCYSNCENKVKLKLTPICSADFANSSAWKVTNPNAFALTYSWTLDGGDPSQWGYGLTIRANGSVNFTTPVGGNNTVSVYVDGVLNDTQSRLAACDCAGTPGGPLVKDDCGVCGGNNALMGCDGICGSGKLSDSCGVCDGGNSALGCDGVCFSALKVDSCGLCGGDGSTCSCTTQIASTKDVKAANKVIKAADVLRDRVSKFSLGASQCGGQDYSAWIKEANSLLRQIKQILSSSFTNSIQSCPGITCVSDSTSSEKRSLNSLTQKMYKVAKKSKLQAIRNCEKPGAKTTVKGIKRKVTEDYRNDLLTAIKGLPAERTSCSK